MIVELLDYIGSQSSIAGVGFVILLFVGGLLAGMKINPGLGLLILGGAYVIDLMISNSIVASGGLDMDRFPMNIEAIAYGVIALAWMVSGTLCAVKRDNAEIERAENSRLEAERAAIALRE